MSTPATGYPDYQNLPQWRGTPLASGNKIISSASAFHAEGWVTNWQSLNCVALLNGNPGVTALVTYYPDSAKLIQVAFYSWVIGVTGGRFAVCIPNVANYVSIDITTIEAGNHPTLISFTPVNVPVGKPSYQVNANFVEQLAISIPANSFQSFVLPFVVEGNGYWYVEQITGVTGFNVSIDFLTEAGAVQFKAFDKLALTGAQSGTFESTSQTMQITVSNLDAAARLFNIYCTALGL